MQNDTPILKDILCLVRSAGERTTEWSRQLLAEIFGSENVQVLQESPFSQAVRRGFELGAASGKKWTFCVDADVLVEKKAVLEFLEFADTTADNVFAVQSLILDKFIPCLRPSGGHLYRNQYALQAIAFIPEEGTELRPETAAIDGMVQQNLLLVQTSIYIGLHDFEQNYVDIFRKTFVHANKHTGMLPFLEAYWRRHADTDSDYKVALLGALAGKVHNATVFIDKRFQAEEAKNVLEMKQMQEKQPLGEQPLLAENIIKLRQEFQIDEGIQKGKYPHFRKTVIFEPETPRQKSRRWLKKSVVELGTFIVRVGNFTKRQAGKI